MATSQDFVNWVCDPTVLDWRYLRWVLMAETASLQRWAHGTTHQTIYFPEVKAFHLAAPSVEEQRTIADVLGALDDKIESNRRVAAAAEALLEHALVGAPSGQTEPLSAVAEFRNGGAITKLANGAGPPIIRIKEMRSGIGGATLRTDVPIRAEHHVQPGDLLFSWSGTLLTVRWDGPAALLNQHVFRVDPRPGLQRWMVEAWVKQHLPSFRAIAEDKATTMGHIQRRHLDEASVVVPNDDELSRLHAQWTPVDQLRVGLLAEARSLVAIRDGLLPKLVSGAIRVPVSNDPEEGLGIAASQLEEEPAAS